MGARSQESKGMKNWLKENVLQYLPLSITITMLFLAIGSGFPYGYYQILRFVVCGVSSFYTYKAYLTNRRIWLWILIAIAILFNPIVLIHFDRNSWRVIDNLVALTLMAFAFEVRKLTTIQKIVFFCAFFLVAIYSFSVTLSHNNDGDDSHHRYRHSVR